MFSIRKIAFVALVVMSVLAPRAADAVLIKDCQGSPDIPCGRVTSLPRQALLARTGLPRDAADRARVAPRLDFHGAYQGNRLDHQRGLQDELKPLRLSATLPGEWDQVEGFVTFPRNYEADDLGRLEIVLRGFTPVPGEVPDEYVVPAWDRNLFFIHPDTNNPDEFPRVLGTVEYESFYQPAPDDDYEIFRDDEPVLEFCTGDNFCSIQVVAYAELQEEWRDYSDYPNGAAPARVYFVIRGDGEPLSAAADIYDENFEYERTDFLYIGDTIEFFMQALDIDQPGLIYLISYMTPSVLSDNFTLERAFLVPGQDYTDTDLPADFDAAVQPIQFLLEGGQAGVDGHPDVFEYSGPFDLGVQWADLPGFVFRSRFNTPTPDRTLPPAPANLARERPSGGPK